jgi:hypothetical protein
VQLNTSSGALEITPPAGSETLRLRMTIVSKNGHSTSLLLEVDFSAGQIREIATEKADNKVNLNGASAHIIIQPVDFATQLDSAALGSRAQDSELMKLIN